MRRRSALSIDRCGPDRGRLSTRRARSRGRFTFCFLGGHALSDDDILKEAREAFERAADAEAEYRRDALDDLKFARLGDQWPEAIRRERDLGSHLLRPADAPPGADPPAGRKLRPRPRATDRSDPPSQRTFAMRRFVSVIASIAAGAALSGCAGLTTFLTTPAGRDGTMGQAILQHLELCKRTYRGALGAGITGSFDIECPAQHPAESAAPSEAPPARLPT